MRAQCCICSDLFVHDDNTDIAATPCGHVFHEHCLARWLATSSTCPQCRKQLARAAVIPKLYFDIADDEQKDGDPAKLSNELQSLQTQVSELKQERSKSRAREQDMKDKLRQKEADLESLGFMLQREQDQLAALQRLLKEMETQKKKHEEEKREFLRTQRKMTELKHVEVLISGGEREMEAILQQYGSDKNSLQQMARYCSILKREYEQAKTEKKTLKEQLEKSKKTAYAASKELSETKSKLQQAMEQLSRSEEDLKQLEKNYGLLSAKYKKMKFSKKHTVDASGSFVTTPQAHGKGSEGDEEMAKTPKIDFDAVTPKMTRPDCENVLDFEGGRPNLTRPDCENALDLDKNGSPPKQGFGGLSLSPRLAASPDLFMDSPRTQVKKACEENKIRMVKLSSAASAPKRLKKESDDAPIDPVPLSSLNIMKKRSGGLMSKTSTIVRKDYNGLGGTSKFTQPVSAHKLSFPRAVHRTAKSGSKKINPPLPTLDSYIDLS